MRKLGIINTTVMAVMWVIAFLFNIALTAGIIAVIAELVVRLTTGHWIR